MKGLFSIRHILPLLGLAVVLAAAVWLLPAVLPHQFNGTLLDTIQPAANFSLPSTQGKPLSLLDLRGKVVLLYFGYTYCPDVCPATLGALKTALESLGSKAEGVQVLMISVDPQRDTLDRLRTFLKTFAPAPMLGLSGDLETTRAIASSYGIFFQAHLPDAAGNYQVDHTAAVILIDKEGNGREVFSFGTPPNAIAQDVDYMLSH
jgi:protein SCO1